MDKYSMLIDSIVSTCKDYRIGEIPHFTREHVNRWIEQFHPDSRAAILQELDHVLKSSYFSRPRIVRFLSNLVVNSDLAGSNPCAFWRTAKFLDIPKHGNSLCEFIRIFDEALSSQCGVTSEACGTDNGPYVYLYDAIFSGNRVLYDLKEWIQTEAPLHSTVHVITIATHASADWYLRNEIPKIAAQANKTINVHYWKAAIIENRIRYKKDAQVFWPAFVATDPALSTYVALPTKFPFEPRPVGGQLGPFSSEESRQLLESEFAVAGARILGFCNQPHQMLRPLGYRRFGLGFGSTLVTFRNCPNNCPLALWWGDANAHPSHPFSKWYPLFPRKVYAAEPVIDVTEF